MLDLLAVEEDIYRKADGLPSGSSLRDFPFSFDLIWFSFNF